MYSTSVPVHVSTPRPGREILLLAEHECRESGFGLVDAEHLLIAAVELCGGMPRLRDVLALHGVAVDRLRRAVRVSIGSGGAPRSSADDGVVCTPAGARVLARAAQLAGPQAHLRPHHVLLAVLDGADDPFMGGAHDLLDSVGVEPRRFRRALGRVARRG